MSLLFPKLNEKKTLDNVSDFFEKDLDRLLLMSGRGLTDITSPRLSSCGGGSGLKNGAEVKLIDGISAGALVEAVRDTIQHCSHNSRIILIELFVKHKSWQEVKPMVYSEHHKFSYLRRRAMFEFADGFNYWQEIHQCQPIVNLHDYT